MTESSVKFAVMVAAQGQQIDLSFASVNREPSESRSLRSLIVEPLPQRAVGIKVSGHNQIGRIRCLNIRIIVSIVLVK